MKNDICMCVKSNIKQQEMKHLVAAFYKLLGIRSTFKTSNGMSYFWKKKKPEGRGGWGHTFSKPPWNFSFLYFTPRNSRQIKAPPLEITQNFITSHLETPRLQISRPLETPYNIFLDTLEIPHYFWYHCPGKSISSTPLLGLFME